MPNISSYGSADKKRAMKKMATKQMAKNEIRKKAAKKKTAMNKPNVRGGMSQSTMRSTPKKRK